MKKIGAIIKPLRLDDVKDALGKLGIEGMTAIEAKGFGRQKGLVEVYRGSEYTAHFLPKLKQEIVLADHAVEAAIKAIVQAARTGKIGDGKIFIITLDEVMRIRTDERGDHAL
jgi:nitrogen regulatory protein P-II 1